MKRFSGVRQTMKSGVRRSSNLQRSSMSSTPSGSQSQLNLSGSGSAVGPQLVGIGSSWRLDHAAIPEDGESVIGVEQEEDDKCKILINENNFIILDLNMIVHVLITFCHSVIFLSKLNIFRMQTSFLSDINSIIC